MERSRTVLPEPDQLVVLVEVDPPPAAPPAAGVELPFVLLMISAMLAAAAIAPTASRVVLSLPCA